MSFFKPTPAKIILALFLTVWPYIFSYFFVNLHSQGDAFSDKMVQFSFFYHAWEWSPLYLIIKFFSPSLLTPLWQSGLFIIVIYPLLRLVVRYIAACIIVFFVAKFFRKHRAEHTA